MVEELLTTSEVARRLGVQSSTIRKWVARGKIPQVFLGPTVRRYDWGSVLKALRAIQRPKEAQK